MTDPQTTPVVINPSPISDQLKSGLRAALVLAAGFGLTKFVPVEWLAFVQSDAFWPSLSIVAGIVAAVWGQIESRLKKKQVVAAATAAPDTKFVVSDTK